METIETIDQILAKLSFFEGFPAQHGALIAGCARLCHFDAGQYLFHEGEAADTFFVIRHGRVALEIAPPAGPPLVVATLGDGDLVGASWLAPPFRTMFGARAMDFTRAIGFDAKCLRGKCDADHSLGYEMMQRFLPVLAKRLNATRMQILDVYGKC